MVLPPFPRRQNFINNPLNFRITGCNPGKMPYNNGMKTTAKGDCMRGFFGRLGATFRRFMQGRYGTDKLNMTILGAGLVLCLINLFIPFPWLSLLLTLISYILMFWAIFRCFSRNTYKRYRENRRYLLWLQRFKDKTHRYFDCPRCRQQVRVPKGKGKISISCPKCGNKFIKKT